jgi:hypothetical protein
MEDEGRFPGALGRRLAEVRAAVARSTAIRDAEERLVVRSLIAVPLDARVQLVASRVKAEAVRQLGIPPLGVEVTKMTRSTFLLHFENWQLRNGAHLR